MFAIAGIVFDVTGGKGFYGPGEHLVSFFDLLEERESKVIDEFIKMGCTGALRAGMRRGVRRNSHLILVRLPLFLSLAPNAVDC